MKRSLLWGALVVLALLLGAVVFAAFDLGLLTRNEAPPEQSYTLPPSLSGGSTTTHESSFVEGVYNVRLKDDFSVSEGKGLIENIGGKVLNEIPQIHLLSAKLTKEQAAVLASDPKVKWIEQERTQPLQFDLSQLYPRLFNVAYAESSPTKLYVIDAGTHGQEVINSAADVINSSGANVDILYIDAPGSKPNSLGINAMADAIVEATDNGADVINISSSCAVDTPGDCENLDMTLQEAFDYAGSKGVVIARPAGNTSGVLDSDLSNPYVISAGGLTPDGCVDTKLSGNTAATQADFYTSPYSPDGTYGTSFSSPRIAAHAAVVMSEPIGLYDTNGNGTWDIGEVEQKLTDEAKTDHSFVDGETLFANGGCINGTSPTPTTPPSTPSNPSTPSTPPPSVGNPSATQAGLGGPLVQQGSDSDPAGYNLCKLLGVANNIITFAVALSVIVATLMFAYGGILYVTAAGGGPEQVKKAHKVLLNAFIGILIVLLAWLIVNIVVSVLSKGDINSWVQVACQGGAATTPSTTQPPPGQVQPVPKTPTQPSAGEEANRAALKATGVEVPNPPCNGVSYQVYRATHNDQGCTDVGGLLPNTIDYLTTLPGYSDCTVTVTGGSEAGHEEHSGGEAVDIRSTSCVSGFVSTFGSNKDPVTDYTWKYEGGDEPHYHVCTGNSCGL